MEYLVQSLGWSSWKTASPPSGTEVPTTHDLVSIEVPAEDGVDGSLGDAPSQPNDLPGSSPPPYQTPLKKSKQPANTGGNPVAAGKKHKLPRIPHRPPKQQEPKPEEEPGLEPDTPLTEAERQELRLALLAVIRSKVHSFQRRKYMWRSIYLGISALAVVSNVAAMVFSVAAVTGGIPLEGNVVALLLAISTIVASLSISLNTQLQSRMNTVYFAEAVRKYQALTVLVWEDLGATRDALARYEVKYSTAGVGTMFSMTGLLRSLRQEVVVRPPTSGITPPVGVGSGHTGYNGGAVPQPYNAPQQQAYVGQVTMAAPPTAVEVEPKRYAYPPPRP